MNPSSQPQHDAQNRAAAIARDPEFERLVRAKRALSTRLSLLMLTAYFGFIGLLAFAPDVLSQRVGSATLGIPLGIGVIVFAWILTGIYVRWANGAYDSMVSRVKEQSRNQ